MNSTNGKHAKPIDTIDDLVENEDLIEMCRDHLTNTHFQLWGRAFNISDPTMRELAAVWLAEEISAVFA